MRKIKNEELNRIDTDTFKASKKLNVIILLDDVRSAMNVGSVFRSSDAFRVEKIVLCGITAKPPHKEINKTALGAQEVVEWEHQESAVDYCKTLVEEGYKILSVEQADESISLLDFTPQPEEKYVLVLGNEVFGVSDELIELSDHVLEIPQFGTKHSLNVSVTAGVLIWDFASKQKKLLAEL